MSKRDWRDIWWALRDAARNAWRVAVTAMVVLGLYIVFITFGPGIEGSYFPVLDNYRLTAVRSLQSGGFSFRPQFEKERDCDYYGVAWFAQDAAGNLTRVQVARNSEEAGPPETGPVGNRVGNRVTIYPPAGTTAIFGVNHHQCRLPWQTRTIVGPFAITNGNLENVPSLRALQRHGTASPSEDRRRAATALILLSSL